MNFLIISVLSGVVGGIAFFFIGDAGAMTENVSILLSFEAIIAAAVLVRLNRGVPSLDWKAVDVEAAERLLRRLEEVAKVYIALIAMTLISITILLAVIYLNTQAFSYKRDIMVALSASFGTILGLVLGRMAYVVWLYLDIVRLQSAVIVSAARAEEAKKQEKVASEKLATIEATRLPRE